jgi:murein DD-endopeptidase MepM/ murein hydrolase activator NlpD
MKMLNKLMTLAPMALFGSVLMTAQPTVAYAQACLQVPVSCQVTSAFGPRYNPVQKNYSTEYHHGVDFGCPIGTSIVAADGGIVNVSGFSQSAGNWVVVRSAGNGPLFKYMHGERLVVSPGAMVNKGQQVLVSGNTGRSTGPHLHFQMEVNGQAADPLPKFCSQPPLKAGVLQGAPPDQTDTSTATQDTAPGGGTPPAMGLEGSVHEVLGDVISSRALNPDYMRQLSTLTEPRLYAEVAYMKAIRLKLQYERSQHRERMLATQAMVQLLRTEGALKPQLDAQRLAATRAGAEQRR